MTSATLTTDVYEIYKYCLLGRKIRVRLQTGEKVRHILGRLLFVKKA